MSDFAASAGPRRVAGSSALAAKGGLRGFWLRHLEDVAAILLGVAALATAWSSYQAAKWGGIQDAEYDRATDMRALATHAGDDAARYRLLDIGMFSRWLEASVAGKTKLSAVYEEYFRPEFRPAFRAWLASDSTIRRSTTPFDMSEYHIRRAADSDSLHAAAVRAQRAARGANDVSDQYVYVTVLLATVLFFAGAVRPLVAMRTQGPILLIALIFCIWSIARIVVAPVAR